MVADIGIDTKARIAGACYLFIIAGGIFAEVMVRQAVLVPGDPAATAARMLEHEALYRAGFGVSLVFLALNLPILVVFYELFRNVDRTLARLMAVLFLVATSVETANLIRHIMPLNIALDPALQAGLGGAAPASLVYLHLTAFSDGFGISLVYFGFYMLVLGTLMRRSGLIPRLLGTMMLICGACYLTNSFALFLDPGIAARLFPWILMPCLVAELSLALVENPAEELSRRVADSFKKSDK